MGIGEKEKGRKKVKKETDNEERNNSKELT